MKKTNIKLSLIVTFFIISASLSKVNAQISSQSEIQKADSFYFAKDWTNAKKLYEHSLKDTSQNATAWNRLGFSYYHTGNLDDAMKSYNKSLQYGRIQPLRASVYSRMAMINSVRDKRDLALANIDSAIANGYSAYTELDSLSDFTSIKNDNRFKDLRQKAYFLAYPCMRDAQNRQFDFWVGEWDAYVRGTNRFAGHSVIQIVSGGCAILENWTSASPNYSGKSLNFIDPATKKWKQTWIGASPDVQEFVNGEYKDGAMRFVFETTDARGHKQLGRFIFYNEGPNQVRQFNEISNDDGKTWTTNYDFTYKRKKVGTGI